MTKKSIETGDFQIENQPILVVSAPAVAQNLEYTHTHVYVYIYMQKLSVHNYIYICNTFHTAFARAAVALGRNDI